ncbi:MAG: PspC domain-containing protein [Myxococcota bacterium]
MKDDDPFVRSPDHPKVPERRQLTKSSNDKLFSGVCAGVAAYLGVHPTVTRVLAVLLTLWVTPFLGLIGYVVAANTLPEEDTPHGPPLSVDWQANSMRVTWKGSTVPYVVSWMTVVQLAAVILGATMLMTLTVGLSGSALSGLASVFPTLLVPIGLIATMFLLVPRDYALTLSESALWIERPTKAPERIELRDIEGFHPSSWPFTIHLKDGTLIELAPPPEGPELDVIVDELQRTLARVRDHDATLEATEDQRERLMRVASSAEAKRQTEGG